MSPWTEDRLNFLNCIAEGLNLSPGVSSKHQEKTPKPREGKNQSP